MVDFRLVVGDPKSKMTFQKVLPPEEAKKLFNLKIGDRFRGETIGLTGYEFQITGASDKDGFPARHDIEGSARKRLLLSTGPGYKPKKKGERKRKSIRGKLIGEDIAQLNTKVVKQGKADLAEFFGKKEEAAPAEEKKEEPKPEAKPKEKKEA